MGFWESIRGTQFVDGTMPRIARALETIGKALAVFAEEARLNTGWNTWPPTFKDTVVIVADPEEGTIGMCCWDSTADVWVMHWMAAAKTEHIDEGDPCRVIWGFTPPVP